MAGTTVQQLGTVFDGHDTDNVLVRSLVIPDIFSGRSTESSHHIFPNHVNYLPIRRKQRRMVDHATSGNPPNPQPVTRHLFRVRFQRLSTRTLPVHYRTLFRDGRTTFYAHCTRRFDVCGSRYLAGF
uniref:(northern house mosquito) hypothetical protein n=1 Tax=Culex pipiens TaxID=7175 RepID=A0A8D8IG72_CULPI